MAIPHWFFGAPAAHRLLVCLVALSPGGAMAELGMTTGVVAHASVPAPIVSSTVVVLAVPHMRQARDLCVPTSTAMILKYFGEDHDPYDLKRLAEGEKPESQRNSTFTLWTDMRRALDKIGKAWYIRDYSLTDAGLQQGLTEIRQSIRAGNPVMIDVHLGPGHTFVVMGFNELERVVYIRDPNVPALQSRILPFDELGRSWHNHRFGQFRSAFFSRR